MFPERVETDRLVLEALDREHVDLLEYYEICSSDPDIDEVTEYVSWSPHATPKETLEFLQQCEEKRENGEGAEYVIRPADDEEGAGEIAGAAGLTVDWDRRTGTLGTWLRKRFWGRGYSGERAAALMELAFERLDLELVAVEHQVGNENSRRAIERYVDRFGGRKDGVLRNEMAPPDGDPVDHVRYSVAAEEYWEAVADE